MFLELVPQQAKTSNSLIIQTNDKKWVSNRSSFFPGPQIVYVIGLCFKVLGIYPTAIRLLLNC